MPKTNYSIFNEFIDNYINVGFEGIQRNDPFIIELESHLSENKQFFYIADVLKMKVLFASANCRTLFGLNPEDISMATFFQRSHPKDQKRHIIARSKTFRTAQDLFFKKGEPIFQSSHFLQKNAQGSYTNTLFQVKLLYAKEPYETVFVFVLLTDLSGFKINNVGFHYYLGNDQSMFRYPDLDLLNIGHLFSNRELEIIDLISKGLESDQISEELFISVYTVNTHRRNILKKTGLNNTRDLVIKMMQKGLL